MTRDCHSKFCMSTIAWSICCFLFLFSSSSSLLKTALNCTIWAMVKIHRRRLFSRVVKKMERQSNGNMEMQGSDRCRNTWFCSCVESYNSYSMFALWNLCSMIRDIHKFPWFCVWIMPITIFFVEIGLWRCHRDWIFTNNPNIFTKNLLKLRLLKW